MALDLTCLQTRKAKRRSASSASVGARFVTTLRSGAVTRPASRDWVRKPPDTLLNVRPGAAGSGTPPVNSRRRFFLRTNTARAPSSASGATTTSVKMAVMRSAAAASKVRFAATMPPKAETGSQRSARSQAAARSSAIAAPHGLACLTMTMAGRSNSATHSKAASVSLRLL